MLTINVTMHIIVVLNLFDVIQHAKSSFLQL